MKKIILANSRIGSLENRKHTPKGGTKQIENFPIRLGHVKARFAFFFLCLIFKNSENISADSKFLILTLMKSKCGSLDNIKHSPRGGNIKIEDNKHEIMKMKQVTSKVGSLERADYKAGGGNIKIKTRKSDFSGIS